MNIDVDVSAATLRALKTLMSGDAEANAAVLMRAGAILALSLATDLPPDSKPKWESLLIKSLLDAGLPADRVERFVEKVLRISPVKAKHAVDNAMALYTVELAGTHRAAIQAVLESAQEVEEGWYLLIRSAFVRGAINDALEGSGLPEIKSSGRRGAVVIPEETYAFLRTAFGLPSK
jgi:hypothetical protein